MLRPFQGSSEQASKQHDLSFFGTLWKSYDEGQQGLFQSFVICTCKDGILINKYQSSANSISMAGLQQDGFCIQVCSVSSGMASTTFNERKTKGEIPKSITRLSTPD